MATSLILFASFLALRAPTAASIVVPVPTIYLNSGSGPEAKFCSVSSTNCNWIAFPVSPQLVSNILILVPSSALRHPW